MFDPCRACTSVDIITVTFVGIGFANIANCGGCACVGIGSITTKTTSTGSPSSIFQSLLDTGVDIGCCTTLHTMVIGFAVVRTLTITSTFTATCTIVGAIATTTGYTVSLTIVAGAAQAVVSSRCFPSGALTVSFSSSSRLGIGQFYITCAIVGIAVDT